MTAQNIALFGRSGAGKTTVSEYLVARRGYQRCHPGKACREIAQRLFQSQSKAVLNRVNDAMREIDPNVWLSVGLRECEPGSPIVVDGMRFKSNYEFLSGKGFWLWKIDAHQSVREGRLSARNQEFNWISDVLHPGESEIETMKFDVSIDNSDMTLEALHFKIDELLGADV